MAVVGYLFIQFSRAGAEREYAYNLTQDNNITTVSVWDPSAKSFVKTFTLPVLPACSSYGPARDYSRVVKMPGTDFAYAIPDFCGGSGESTVLKVALINTKSHSYSGTQIDVTFSKSAVIDAVINPQKKQLYLYDTNSGAGNLVVIDSATNKVIKNLSLNTYGRAVQLVPSGDGAKLAVLYGRPDGTILQTANSASLVTLDTVAFETLARGNFGESFGYHGSSTGAMATADASGRYLYAVLPSFVTGTSGHFTKIRIAKIDLVSMQATYSADINAMVNCYTSKGMDMVATSQGVYLLAGTTCPATNEDVAESRLYLYNPSSQAVTQVLGKEVGIGSRLFTKSDNSGLYITAVYPDSGTFLSEYSYTGGALSKVVLGEIKSIVSGGAITVSTSTPTATATPAITQAPGNSAPTSTGTWTADKLLLVKGTLTTKADGAKQITSVKEGNWSVSHFSLDNVAADTYCVSGTAPAGSYSQIIARYDELGRTVADPAQLSPLAAGAFETCASLAARPADQPSAPSHVFVQIYSPATTPTTVDKMYIQSASTNPAPASSS